MLLVNRAEGHHLVGDLGVDLRFSSAKDVGNAVGGIVLRRIPAPQLPRVLDHLGIVVRDGELLRFPGRVIDQLDRAPVRDLRDRSAHRRASVAL